jgi:hypothetical protein
MRFETQLPRVYDSRIWALPAFDSHGKITERVRASLENTLYLFSESAKIHSRNTHNNPRNFMISGVKIVGSCARENKEDSDIDYLLISPSVDDISADFLKEMMSYVLFCDRDKRQAIDIYIRTQDKYPSRASTDVTHQVRGLLKKYNRSLNQD